MAEIWCLLLRKAERVYAWGTIDITLPLDWFVSNDVFAFTLERRNALLQRLGWQVVQQHQYTEYVCFETKFMPAPDNIFHNVTTSLRSNDGRTGLQDSIDSWFPVQKK
jgi:hypothetical protein